MTQAAKYSGEPGGLRCVNWDSGAGSTPIVTNLIPAGQRVWLSHFTAHINNTTANTNSTLISDGSGTSVIRLISSATNDHGGSAQIDLGFEIDGLSVTETNAHGGCAFFYRDVS